MPVSKGGLAKMKRENREMLGIAGFFSALVLSFALVVLAIRKRSVAGAICALIAAAGSSASIGVLLTRLFAPDTEGEHVVATAVNASDAELFSADEVDDAMSHMCDALGGRCEEEVAKTSRPTINGDGETTEAD